MQPKRSIATILVTDIVGSTERAAELGDHRWRDLLEQHHTLVREILGRWGGTEANETGDGFVSLFDNPAHAIICAAAIRNDVREMGLEVRCGVHLGEVEHNPDGSIRGIAVHIAVRVSAAASAGEILVSTTVRDAESGSGFSFEDRGERELKGVPRKWHLFAVTDVPELAAPPRQRMRWLTRRRQTVGTGVFILALVAAGTVLYVRDRGPRLSPERLLAADAAPAIAVLPFTVRGEAMEIWREGMVDLLSTGLDGAAGLRTISSRTLLARWREQVPDDQPPDLATTLQVAWTAGARYALVGSAVAIGPNVRLVADAYDIDTGERLGQAQVEGPPDDVLALCDRLGVEALAIILQKGEEELPQIDLATLMSDTTAAMRAFLEGEVHFRRFDVGAAEKAYKRAVDADSTFALAHYRLSIVYRWERGGRSRTLSLQHLRRAVQLADRLPARQAVVVRAVHGFWHQTPDLLVELMRQAVQTYPDEAEAWYWLGEGLLHNLAAMAPAEEIDQAFERAVELDPGNAQYFWHYVELAWTFHSDSALAAQRLEKFERVAPGDPHAGAGRLALDLAFGDGVAQRAATIQLRSEDLKVVQEVPDFLVHPRYAALQPVMHLLHERGDDNQRRRSAVLLFDTNARWYGRLREALPYLDDPAMTAGPRALVVYRALVAGLPIPEEQIEQALDPTLIDSVASPLAVFHVGAFAADRGRWSDHARAIAELERQRERALGQVDSTAAGQNEGAVRALEGYGLWQRGQPTAALPMLEDPRAVRPPWFVIPLWLSRLYQELGRLRDAERVYRSSGYYSNALTIEPLVQNELGRVYEALEEYDKARESYEYFVEYWRDADPELQPMVEEARQAIIRLQGLQRE